MPAAWGMEGKLEETLWIVSQRRWCGLKPESGWWRWKRERVREKKNDRSKKRMVGWGKQNKNEGKIMRREPDVKGKRMENFKKLFEALRGRTHWRKEGLSRDSISLRHFLHFKSWMNLVPITFLFFFFFCIIQVQLW